MLCKVITSGKGKYIGLFPIEYGWWLVTCFTKEKQEVLIVLEDDWAELWGKRGWPLEIYTEEGDH